MRRPQLSADSRPGTVHTRAMNIPGMSLSLGVPRVATTGLVLACSIVSCTKAVREPTSAVPSSDSARTQPQSEAEPASTTDDERGGQLYDTWFAVIGPEGAFVPDDPSTPGVADGKGGPNGDGTLLDGAGRPMLNDSGHAYRVKNFFGWDLAGGAGIYGPEYKAKVDAARENLLDDALDPADLRRLIADGSDDTPAWSSVLDAAALDDLVAFILRVRANKLARADQVWHLSAGTPGNYVLREGADVQRGHELFADRCSGCHGSDGTDELFHGGALSLGMHSRRAAYEDWFKILNGHPGSVMDRQVDTSVTGAEQSQQILDMLAALCDRTQYPKGPATGEEIADGDPRCASYLR